MRIKLSEKTNPRYIYVNQLTNVVHLLVPVTTGTEIALDNTCMTVLALQEFFGKKADSKQRKNSARDELLRFKKDLESDIQTLLGADDVMQLKVERLNQVEAYINALNQIEYNPCLNQLSGAFPIYPEPIKKLLALPASNLYSMRLRPSHQDLILRTQNPIFTMNRERSSNTFYHALKEIPVRGVASTTHRDRFTNNVVQILQSITLPAPAGTIFPYIQQILSETHKQMFGDEFNLNFNITPDDLVILGYDSCDPDSGIESKEELEEIIKLLVSRSTEGDAFPLESSFNELSMPLNKEKFGIMVQFLVGEINIYAHSKGLTNQNFGDVLDTTPQFLVIGIIDALQRGSNIEQYVCKFINAHLSIFKLKSKLTPAQIDEISARFNSHYQLVKDSPHMDEFMILDPAGADKGRFFTHQNSICFDFADLMNIDTFQPYSHPYNQLFERARMEVSCIPGIVPSRDTNAAGFFNVDTEIFKAAIKKGLENDNIAEVCKILSETDGKENVFEKLGQEFFAEFESNEKAQRLLLEVRRSITDGDILNHYNKVVLGSNAQILLTPEMARTLYVAVAATKELTPARTLKFSTEIAVKELLRDLNFDIKNITATAGYNGDIVIDASKQQVAEITAILANYTNAIHLTNSMAASLYKQVMESYGIDSSQYKEMMALSNEEKMPLKLIEALKLLNIQVQPESMSYPNNNKGRNGYIIRNIKPEALRIIEEAHDFHENRFVLTRHMEKILYLYIEKYYPVYFNENISNLNNEGRPNRLEAALEYLKCTCRNIEFHGCENYDYVIFVPPLQQARISGLGDTLAGRGLVRGPQKPGPSYQNPRRHLFAGETNVEVLAPSVLSNKINISRVQGFGDTSTIVPARIKPGSAQLNCPAHILRAFQELLRGSRILGAGFTNPYTNVVERFPTQVEQLTPRHLQTLARVEDLNTDGVMKTEQYNGLLNDNHIAIIRALVKVTTVAGITYAERVGGYGASNIVELNPHHKVIVIDQSGFQWQKDKRNTGGLYFYPSNGAPGLPAEYDDWQRNTYQSMFNAPRPAAASSNSIAISWDITPGQLDLNEVARGIELEFAQALDAAVSQGKHLDANERINFAFLKAGMGLFTGGLFSTKNLQLLESARLQGILNALKKIQIMPLEQRAEIFGKLGRIELPYSREGDSQLLTQIRDSVLEMGLEWGGAEPIGGYFLRPGWVTATTNCGDPHAMPSNEGGYSSVDAEMGSNAYLHHLNATFNTKMSIRVTSFQTPQYALNLERIEAALRKEINSKVHFHGGIINQGHWFTYGGIEYGPVESSNLLRFSTADFNVIFETDNSISVQNKRVHNTEVTGDTRLNVLTDFCSRMNLQIVPPVIIKWPELASSPFACLETQFIRDMLATLIKSNSNTPTVDAQNKVLKLEAILAWLEWPSELLDHHQDVVLAFARDVCSLSFMRGSPNNPLGLFPPYDPLREFFKIMEDHRSIPLDRLSRITFSWQELNNVMIADHYLDDLICSKVEQLNRLEPR